MKIKDHKIEDIAFLESPNFNDRPDPNNISLIVIHSISLPSRDYNNDNVESFFLNNLDISKNEYFKEIVIITSTRSPCERLHVGCLLVKDNRIVSQGYNGFLSGLPHISHIVDGHETATIHTEQNAIIDCAKRGVSCE